MFQSPDYTEEQFMSCTMDKVRSLFCWDVVQCRLATGYWCVGTILWVPSSRAKQSKKYSVWTPWQLYIYIISTWSSVKIMYDKNIRHKFCIYFSTNEIYSNYVCWSSGKSIIESCNILMTHFCVTVITLWGVRVITET
jgi:hypothetical protein